MNMGNRLATVFRVIMLSALAALPVGMSAAVQNADTISARRAFVEMPIDILDILGKSTRLDMLDFYAADSIYQARNTMEGLSRLDTVAPRYLKVTLTPVTTLSINVLPVRNGDILMTAYTIGDSDQAYDTDLRFYTPRYAPLPRSRYFKTPLLEDFFDFPDKKSRELVRRIVPFPTMRYTPSPDGTEITAELTVDQFVSADDYKQIMPFMKKTILYRWDGKRFCLER